MDDAKDADGGAISDSLAAHGAPRSDGGGWQTRVLSERFGRTRVAVAVIVFAFWIVAPNMPSSAVRDELAPLWRSADAVGLSQDWAVFSPNPRSESLDVRARIEFDDGAIEFWDVPDFDPVIGAFRQYRWHKWQERIRRDDRDENWQPTAEWIADQHLRDGVRPLRVTLIRRWIDHQPLTADGPPIDGGWNEFEFYTWERDT